LDLQVFHHPRNTAQAPSVSRNVHDQLQEDPVQRARLLPQAGATLDNAHLPFHAHWLWLSDKKCMQNGTRKHVSSHAKVFQVAVKLATTYIRERLQLDASR
jgi:hypothetical protein